MKNCPQCGVLGVLHIHMGVPVSILWCKEHHYYAGVSEMQPAADMLNKALAKEQLK